MIERAIILKIQKEQPNVQLFIKLILMINRIYYPQMIAITVFSSTLPMEQSSSYDETTVRHQFDRKCKLALDGEVVDYDRHMDYRRKHEILFSELSECQTGKLSVVDEYNETSYFFKTCEYDVKVKSSLLAEALNALTDRKREVILLSYFMEMSDAAIARKMNLVRSTVHEHRTRSLELLKQIMEENKSECKK